MNVESHPFATDFLILCHGSLINKFFWPVYQPPVHFNGSTLRATLDILHYGFEGMIISPRCNVNWQTILGDFTATGFFLGTEV